MYKPQLNIRDAHPETMMKSFQECQKILKKLNHTNPNINLKGYNLLEYLMFQKQIFYQRKRHPDTEVSSWLLEEKIVDEEGKIEYSIADYQSFSSMVELIPRKISFSAPLLGCRFIIVPKA